MHGLAYLCDEAGNGGNNGRRCPTHARTVFLSRPFYFLLPWGIVFYDLFIAELCFVQVIASKDKAAFLLNRALSCFQYRGDVSGNAISDRVRRSVLR